MYPAYIKPGLDSVMTAVAGSIRLFSDQVDQYLEQIGKHEVMNPFERPVVKTPNGSISRVYLEKLGIRQLITWQDHLGIEKDDITVQELQTLFGNSQVIQFAEWTKTENASDSWDSLLSDVIKPVKKEGFEFLFHLGDTTARPWFEVDEIIDIIRDYSTYGRVTLILDEQEAEGLLKHVNAMKPKDKYLFLFDTIDIDNLLVFCGNRTVIFSRDWQFDFGGLTNSYDRICFNAGYQLGLLMHLEVSHCIVLGLTVSQAYTEHTLNSRVLLTYLNNRISVKQ